MLLAATLMVWDEGNQYHLLSCRDANAHSGALNLLIWNGMQQAAVAGRAFDFDGTPTPGMVRF